MEVSSLKGQNFQIMKKNTERKKSVISCRQVGASPWGCGLF
jgi:hypothetical protein